MPDLGLDVLFKGKNFYRLIAGLGVALRISLIAVIISILLGILLGSLMTGKNKIVKFFISVYTWIFTVFSIFRNYQNIRLGLIRRDFCDNSIFYLGSSRDERFSQIGSYKCSKAPV